MGQRIQPEIRQGSRSAAGAIGATFRDAREMLGLSQHQVADLTAERGLPVSRSALCDIERGRNLPGIESLVSLCDVLEVDPLEILGRIKPPQGDADDLAKRSLDDLWRRAAKMLWSGQYQPACALYGLIAERLELDRSYDVGERRRFQAKVEIGRSFALKQRGKLGAAEAAAKRALHFASGAAEVQVEALVVLSGLHLRGALLPLAEAESDKALRIAETDGGPRLLGLAWGTCANALKKAARNEEAAQAFIRARGFLETSYIDRSNLVKLEGNIGACLLDLGHPSAARKQFLKAVALARKNKNPPGEALWQIATGRLAFLRDELDEAEERIAMGLQIARTNDDPLMLFRGLWLQHQIAGRRGWRNSDRHRVAYLKRLYPRVANYKGLAAVQEFRREVLGLGDA